MAKKAKSDLPTYLMTVENGRLIPASAWEAETLSTFRNGEQITVHLTRAKANWRQRKYWAVLARVIEVCNVRQKSKEDLHRAIRLKLGVVDSYETFGGNLKVELRSTSSMTEDEFKGFYESAMELLSSETGVDVETLKKESGMPDGKDDEDQQPVEPDQNAGLTPADDTEGNAAAADGEGEDQTATGDAGSSPNSTTLDHISYWHHPESHSYYVVAIGETIDHDGFAHEITAEEYDKATGAKPIADGAGDQPNAVDNGGSESGTTDAPAEPLLTDEEWLKRSARMVWAASWKFKQDILKVQVEGIKDDFTPAHITQAARDKLSAIYKECRMVAYGEVKREDVLPKVAAIAGVEPKWLNQDERREDVT